MKKLLVILSSALIGTGIVGGAGAAIGCTLPSTDKENKNNTQGKSSDNDDTKSISNNPEAKTVPMSDSTPAEKIIPASKLTPARKIIPVSTLTPAKAYPHAKTLTPASKIAPQDLSTITFDSNFSSVYLYNELKETLKVEMHDSSQVSGQWFNNYIKIILIANVSYQENNKTVESDVVIANLFTNLSLQENVLSQLGNSSSITNFQINNFTVDLKIATIDQFTGADGLKAKTYLMNHNFSFGQTYRVGTKQNQINPLFVDALKNISFNDAISYDRPTESTQSSKFGIYKRLAFAFALKINSLAHQQLLTPSDFQANSPFEFKVNKYTHNGLAYANINIIIHPISDWMGDPVWGPLVPALNKLGINISNDQIVYSYTRQILDASQAISAALASFLSPDQVVIYYGSGCGPLSYYNLYFEVMRIIRDELNISSSHAILKDQCSYLMTTFYAGDRIVNDWYKSAFYTHPPIYIVLQPNWDMITDAAFQTEDSTLQQDAITFMNALIRWGIPGVDTNSDNNYKIMLKTRTGF